MIPSRPIPVGLLGATGMVGQRFALQLQRHPWFRLLWLGAGPRSAKRRYRDATHWVQDSPMPRDVARLEVREAAPEAACPELVFSAMDPAVAGGIERAFARAGHAVLSNSRNHRLDDDVPLVVPEINPEHLELIAEQRRRRKWSGCIVANPNCSTATLVMALAPLAEFGVRRVLLVTLQAVSGAGHPGVSAVDALGNAIPFIAGEEEKLGAETAKILGRLETGGGDGARVVPSDAVVSAHCNRVPVVDGHLACASVELEEKLPVARVRRLMDGFSGAPQRLGLPSAPRRPLRVLDGPDRPQPRRDVAAGGGMTVSVGRLRECAVLDVKFAALGHNTIRGAAGASVLNAELMAAEGRLS